MSYIIGFFKVIFIWFGLVIASMIPGYILNALLKPLKLRIVAGIGIGVGLIALGFLNLLPASTLYYGFCGAYMLSVFVLGAKDIAIKGEYKKMQYVSSNLDLAWAVTYGNILNILFLSFPDFQSIIPFEIKHFSIYLYVNYGLFLLMPVYTVSDVMARVSRIQSKILKNKIITGDEIFEEFNSMLSDNDTEEEQAKKMENLLEIITHFEESGKIVQVDVNSDGFMYIELETYKNMKNEINGALVGQKKVTINEIARCLNGDLKLKTVALENVIESIIGTYDDWFKFNNLFIQKSHLEEIEAIIKNQILSGNFNSLEIEAKFSINKTVLEEIMTYCQIEIATEQRSVNTNITVSKFDDLSPVTSEVNQDVISISEKVMIDVNHASEEEFRRVSGIGVVLSKKIIRYRDEKNGFESVEEFLNFAQISPHKIAIIKENLKCTPRVKVTKKLVGRRLEV